MNTCIDNITIGIVGMGLIGGSLAKSFRTALPDCRIIACTRNESARKSAYYEGVADETCPVIDDTLRPSDIVFLCGPINANCENLAAVAAVTEARCILTDVSGVKQPIHRAAKALGQSVISRFIGGHPMAGTEHAGYEHSFDGMFRGATYLLTPEESSDDWMLDRYSNLVRSIGAVPYTITPARHDAVTAAISHLPHIMSASLVDVVSGLDDDGFMALCAAGGFKGLTRISSSDPSLWSEISLANSEDISAVLDAYIKQLESVQAAIQEGDRDGLYELFNRARQYRGKL